MIVLFTNIPTPYRIPLFNLLNEKLKNINNELFVVFYTRIYKHRKWEVDLEKSNFNYNYLENLKIDIGKEKVFYIPFGIRKQINKLFKEKNVECIVVNAFSPMTLYIVWKANKANIPYIVWTGETEAESKMRKLKVIRKFLRKYIIKNAKAFIVYGTRAKEFLVNDFNVSEDKIYVGINSVDTTYFVREVNNIKNTTVKNPNEIKLLYVGHLIKRKGVIELLQAIQLIKTDVKFSLDIIGDGEYKETIRKFIIDNKLKNINMLGYKQKEELPYFYAKSDIYIFPSLSEIYGLVLVEAASSGLPIIASRYAGGTCDVVQDGYNGFVVDTNNLSEYASKIKYLIENPNECKRMGHNSELVIRNEVNIEKSSKGFFNAIKETINAN